MLPLLPSVLVAASPGRLPQAGAACPGSWLQPRGGKGPGLGVLCPPPRCSWGWASTMRGGHGAGEKGREVAFGCWNNSSPAVSGVRQAVLGQMVFLSDLGARSGSLGC